MDTDDHIWKEIKQGNKKVLSQLFMDFYDDLFRYAKRFESDEDNLKDLIQELFLNIWKNHKRLADSVNVQAYLFRAIRNISINKRKDPLIRISELSEDAFAFYTDDFNSSDELLEVRKKKLLPVLNELPPKQREAIYLKYFQGMDMEEIAIIMNQNKQSVRNNLHRAMLKMREKMILQLLFAAL